MIKNNLKMQMHIGQRMVKTAVAVLICFIIYLLRGKQGIPFYSAIAAILCMQPYVGHSGKVAKNRVIGTLIGAIYGLVVLLLCHYLDFSEFTILILISIFVIPVIKTAVDFNKSAIAYFSCVVFLSIVSNHRTDEVPYLFVANRVIDTLVGVFVSLVVNWVHLPRKKNKDILFVSGLDDTLLNRNGELNAYSIVEMNRMLEQGIHFTVSTEQTPASLIVPLRDIHMNLPVITMNGAALYDIENNKYIKKETIPIPIVKKIREVLKEEQMQGFFNFIIQDTLMIYFEEFCNENMREVYRKLRKNPLRNYICGEIPENLEAVYIYIIDSKEKIERLKNLLENLSLNIRIVDGEEREYAGSSYLKIYSNKAMKSKMNRYLADCLKIRQIITYGSIDGTYDVVIQNGDDNLVVKSIKSIFEPVFWKSL
ncbi:MAG: HAD hydrolase family protein [Lachnospiraceae bacterium]|nr:HAD hydrolase family protein [Lachnospiraceae bacterium]